MNDKLIFRKCRAHRPKAAGRSRARPCRPVGERGASGCEAATLSAFPAAERGREGEDGPLAWPCAAGGAEWRREDARASCQWRAGGPERRVHQHRVPQAPDLVSATVLGNGPLTFDAGGDADRDAMARRLLDRAATLAGGSRRGRAGLPRPRRGLRHHRGAPRQIRGSVRQEPSPWRARAGIADGREPVPRAQPARSRMEEPQGGSAKGAEADLGERHGQRRDRRRTGIVRTAETGLTTPPERKTEVLLLFVVSPVGIEPTTPRLKVT